MSASEQDNFIVRDHDCDALGHLYTGNYLRFAEDAAHAFWQRLTHRCCGGEDLMRAWAPAQTVIDLHRPLISADRFVIQTQLAGHEPGQVHLVHIFTQDEEDEPAAICQTRWAAAANGNAQTDTVAQTVRVMLREINPVPTWHSAPPPPPPPEGMVEMQRWVGWRDVSPRGRVFTAAYMDYMVDSAILAGDSFGWNFQASLEAGFAFVARRQWIEILSPAGLGDALRIRTWLYRMRRTTAYRNYILTRMTDDEVVARGCTYWAAVDFDSGRPSRIPEAFLIDLARHIASD
ncbi:MAG: acyl-CoA thioesterase [Anaerolineales bacterium]|nr:acyl-CoA thioesterase [Anaerolineales bacterium]